MQFSWLHSRSVASVRPLILSLLNPRFSQMYELVFVLKCELIVNETEMKTFGISTLGLTLRSFTYISQLGANMFMNTAPELYCHTTFVKLSNAHQRLLLPNGLNKWSSTALEQGLFYFSAREPNRKVHSLVLGSEFIKTILLSIGSPLEIDPPPSLEGGSQCMIF